MSSRVLAVTMKILIHVFLTAWVLTAAAHHNPVVYDGKRTVTITGVVTAARFAFPHSRYSIDVTAEDGTVERWLLSAEDPKDATKLGFADALKGIKVGDLLSVVGWPHKTRSRELRAHQLHYPNGDVVTMRPGNYLWTKALRRIWRLRDGQEPFATNFGQISSDVTLVKRVIHWINENDAVPRVAYEIRQNTAKLIGVNRGNGLEFPGVRKLFRCHTERARFRHLIDYGVIGEEERTAISNGEGFIARYNDLLATYWEFDVESC